MAQDFTSTALVASVKRRGQLADQEEAFTTDDLLAIATEELQSYVMELLVDVQEEYGVADYDVAVVSGTSSYATPARAIGDKLRNVLLSVNGSNYNPLPRLEPEREGDFVSTSSGQPYGYLFQDNSVVLVPTPNTSGTLRMKYFRRPSKLVQTTAVATIASINGARTVITTSSTIPSTMTSGVTLDVVDATPGFRILAMDAATTGTVSGTTITLTTALPASVAAGDYVCLAGESPVPQVPVELHPLLAQRTLVKVAEAQGSPRVKTYLDICDRMRATAVTLLTPRSEGSSRVILNPNGPGYRRWSRGV